MKRLLLFILLLSLLSCEDEGSRETLPPATQTGAGTFGCLVDGKVFIHNDGIMNCFYQFVDGGYYFGIQGKNRNLNPSSIILGTYDMAITEGMSYQLLESTPNNSWGGTFFRIPGENGIPAYTDSNFTGSFTITRLDFVENIVSGTFWFDVQHPVSGETVEIRDGRFDTHFSE